MKFTRETIIYTLKQSLRIMAGYCVMGFGFGILLQKEGYPWWVATLMCITIFGGSMQYAAVDILSSGANIISAALMTVMINARYIFYSFALVDKYKILGKEKPMTVFQITDETFSLVCSPEIPDYVDKRTFFFLLSAMNHSYWIIGGTLGGLVGTAITFDTTGIGFAMTAVFTVAFVGQWESTKNKMPLLVGFTVSLLCLVILGADSFLIPSMLIITALLFILRKLFEEVPKNE